jgi:hypothetical protein
MMRSAYGRQTPPPRLRWKPLDRQPLGWDFDLHDGVRLNIRPLIEAKVLARS